VEIHQIKYFLAVCEELNFTRAAKRCNVAQPSLSTAIQRLEKELRGRLFIRAVTGVQLTNLGRAVRPHFKKIDLHAELVQSIFSSNPTAARVGRQRRARTLAEADYGRRARGYNRSRTSNA
jgi:LysR family transcriptional regulator, hydrogen peroxide-inducible genes activator